MGILHGLLAVVVFVGIVIVAMAILSLIGTILVGIFWVSSILALMVFFGWLFLFVYQEMRKEREKEARLALMYEIKREREIQKLLEEANYIDKEKPLN